VLIRVGTGIFLLWATTAVVVAVAAFVLAIGGDRHEQRADQGASAAQEASPTAQPEPVRPSAVPPGAQLVTRDVQFGQVPATPGATPEAPRLFYALSCRDHLLTVATTRETIYAELPCDQYQLSDDVVRPYLGKPVSVRVSTGPPALLIIEVLSPGPAQFVTDRVWIQSR
jgi:hypothetical protein